MNYRKTGIFSPPLYLLSYISINLLRSLPLSPLAGTANFQLKWEYKELNPISPRAADLQSTLIHHIKVLPYIDYKVGARWELNPYLPSSQLGALPLSY